MTQQEEKLAGTLAIAQAETKIKGFVSRIVKAIQAKNITLLKVLQIYAIIEKAVKDVEAVIATK